MKTYPINRSDGSMLAFEIGNSLVSLRRITRVLGGISGVSGVRPMAGGDDRLMFEFGGESCVVNEPFGDNSRYWIGPAFPEGSTLDMKPVQLAFAVSQGPVSSLWNALFGETRA